MTIRLYPNDKTFTDNVSALRDMSQKYNNPHPRIVVVLDGEAIETTSIRMLPGDTFCYTGKREPYGENRVELSRIDQVYFWFEYEVQS